VPHRHRSRSAIYYIVIVVAVTVTIFGICNYIYVISVVCFQSVLLTYYTVH